MKKLLFGIAAIVLLAACDQGKDQPAVTPILDVNTETIQAEAAAKDYTKSVTSNCDWTATVTDGEDWISVSPTSDKGTAKRKKTLTIHVDANTEDVVREGEITISNGKTGLIIPVVQESASGPVGDDPEYPAYDNSKPIHLAWNFHVMTDPMGNPYNHSTNYTSIRGSAYDYSWSAEARFPAPNDPDSFNAINNRCYPTEANHETPLGAYLSVCDWGKQHVPAASGTSASPASITGNGGFSFNPSFQVQMLQKDDFIYVAIPVKNLQPTARVTFESSVGGAASAAGFFKLEYSVDFDEESYSGDWYEVPGGYVYGTDIHPAYGYTGASTLAGCTGDTYHFWNTYYNQRSQSQDTKGTRYVFGRDKSVDDGYELYDFTLSEISPVTDGYLYIRLRSFHGLRANEGNKATAGGWTDFKFFDVYLYQ